MLEVTSPIWVVQNCKDRQTGKILTAIKEVKEPFIMATYDLNGLLEVSNNSTDLIPYGSTSLIEFAKSNDWRYVFHNDNFRTDVYTDKHPYMLNNDAITMSLSAFKLIAASRPSWFIRPALDSKPFPGHTASSEELLKWIARLEEAQCEVDGNTLVSVASPKVIDMEWRYFVVGNKIITGSSYRCRGSVYWLQETDTAVLREAQELADTWLPHECCCMDVALVDGKAHIIEFNGLNASGFYDHNVAELVREVSSYARDRSYHDRRVV